MELETRSVIARIALHLEGIWRAVMPTSWLMRWIRSPR